MAHRRPRNRPAVVRDPRDRRREFSLPIGERKRHGVCKSFDNRICSASRILVDALVRMSSGGRAVVARALLNFLSNNKTIINKRSLLIKRQDSRIGSCRAIVLFSRKSYWTCTEPWPVAQTQNPSSPTTTECFTRERRKFLTYIFSEQMPRTRRRHRSRSHSRTRSHSAGSPQYEHKRRRIDYESPQTKGTYSGERVLRSRQHERGTSQDRRYKRSHRRSPSSGRQHSHVHGHRDRDRDRERAHVAHPTSSRRTRAHRHHATTSPSQETSRHHHRSPSSRSQVSTWVVTHPFLLFSL